MLVQIVLTVLSNTSRKYPHVILHMSVLQDGNCQLHQPLCSCILVAYHVNVCKISNTFIMPILFKAESWFNHLQRQWKILQQCLNNVRQVYTVNMTLITAFQIIHIHSRHSTVLLQSVFPHRHLITTQKIMCSLKSSHDGCKF